MGSVEYEGVDMLSCSQCSGRFVQFMRLRSILGDERQPRSWDERSAALDKAATAHRAERDERDPLPCPVCGLAMRRYVHQHSSGVWIDTCSPHGAWLDAGELEQLEAWTEATRAGRPSSAGASADEHSDWIAWHGDDADGIGDLLGRLTNLIRGRRT
jgi:Zn-finger nucleic acid-binding protein